MLTVKQLDHLTITSTDPERSIAFYKGILGMRMAFDWPGEIAILQAGETYLAVARWQRGSQIEPQPAITVHHFAFKVDAATFEHAKTWLPSQGIKIDLDDHGIHQSIYFRDPDNHIVELACYDLKGAAEKMPEIL